MRVSSNEFPKTQEKNHRWGVFHVGSDLRGLYGVGKRVAYSPGRERPSARSHPAANAPDATAVVAVRNTGQT